MAEVVTMPRLSDTMEEGVIAEWHVKVGDTVSSGDLMAEIESDKATMDFEAPEDGVVLHLGVEKGAGIPVGALLAIIGEKGEDVADIVASHAAGASEAPAEAVTEEAPVQQPEAPAPVAEVPATPLAAPVVAEAATVSAPSDGRLKVSPLAKAMAKERGIDLNLVNGSGDHGRIVKRDIESFVPPVAVPAAAPLATNGTAEADAYVPPTVFGQEQYEEVRVSQMRKTIARRLSESKFTSPHFYLTMEINMDNAVEARKRLNEISPVKISYNTMVIKATAAALRQHPKVNSSWLGDKIRYNQHINIGMAVAVDEGLLVPVIRFADSKGLAAIAAESKKLAGMARDRTLQPADWEGSTFTISNLGMFGIEEFTAIINPPDACILAVGGIKQTPIVKDGEVVPGHVMKVTLSCDHRVVDGALGSEFLVTLKNLLEDPMRILI
ncbi:MAG: pyruvate dehydrogenase complex dihydrolipoamide acetyltransferase [Bacteroidota bacterium]